MATIIIPRVAVKGMSKGALRGPLECPHLGCNGTNHKYVENQATYMIRYRCGTCHKTFLYDFSANMNHPYKTFGKSKFRQMVDAWDKKVLNKD